MPAIGAKECIFNLNLAFLDPGDVALASDPGYPVYTGGPLLAGAEPVLMPLEPELGFAPDLDAIPGDVAEPRATDVLQLPEQPDRGRPCPTASSSAPSSSRGQHDILAVHDNAYSETTYDGYVAPSFLATPGAKDVGVEVFSLVQGLQHDRLALRRDSRQRGGDRPLLAPEVERRLGPVRGGAAGRASPRSIQRSTRDVKAMNAVYARRRDLVCDALAQAGRAGDQAEGHDLHLGARSRRVSRARLPTASTFSSRRRS